MKTESYVIRVKYHSGEYSLLMGTQHGAVGGRFFRKQKKAHKFQSSYELFTQIWKLEVKGEKLDSFQECKNCEISKKRSEKNRDWSFINNIRY